MERSMSLGVYISTGFLNTFLNKCHSGNTILNFVIKPKSLSEVPGQVTLPVSYCKPYNGGLAPLALMWGRGQFQEAEGWLLGLLVLCNGLGPWAWVFPFLSPHYWAHSPHSRSSCL